jgi:hypothetical protein
MQYYLAFGICHYRKVYDGCRAKHLSNKAFVKSIDKLHH